MGTRVIVSYIFKLGTGEMAAVTEGQEIVRGETYDHAEYGQVEVTGIWKGVERADTAHNTEVDGAIIVRYAPEDDTPRVQELTDTLDEFISAVE